MQLHTFPLESSIYSSHCCYDFIILVTIIISIKQFKFVMLSKVSPSLVFYRGWQ